MQPIQSATPRSQGESSSATGEQPLSTQQRTVLERLITRISALNQQQSVELWAGLNHALGLKNGAPLLSRHFPAAEQHLNQRLASAQTTLASRQMIQQISDLLPQGNNRQTVSDFIRQQFGQTALSQLTPEQLKTVLTRLQHNPLPLPQPQQRLVTERPLLPAEHNSLNPLVMKLSAATGESGKQIWQTMLELSGVPASEQIPAKHFTLLTTWLQAKQTLSHQPAPDLHNVQAALKRPLDPQEWKTIVDYSQQRFQATPQTLLTTAQVQEILNQVFLIRAGRLPAAPTEVRNIQPIDNPLFRSFIEPISAISARSGLALLILVVSVILFFLLL